MFLDVNRDASSTYIHTSVFFQTRGPYKQALRNKSSEQHARQAKKITIKT